MTSKSRSSLSETPTKAASPATPRVSRLSRGVAKSEQESPSHLQTKRLSIDQSPRSVNSKPTIERRSTKLSTPPDKQPTRVVGKGSELQTQLNQAQEDLNKAKEQITLIEKEKALAIEGLNEAHRVAEEANEKLREALMAQKRAEDSSEIDKFRAVELEQSGIEAVQKKEEEWQKELEAVRNQHALDVDALLSTTQELHRVKQELLMTSDSKNQALSHADDATKIAEIHAEKVEILSVELIRLKGLLDSKLDTEVSEHNKMASKLQSEIDCLKEELDKARSFEEKLHEKEASIEQLNVELEAAKMAESYARNLVGEWKNKVDELELQAEEACKLERSASESLNSIMKQLEGSNDLLHDAKSEIAALKENFSLLETTIGRQKRDLEESQQSLATTKEENSQMMNVVEFLKSEIETVKEEKAQALNNEKEAASNVQNLLEERNKLMNELENSKNEEDKSKKAMESLTLALHEASAEGRQAKEKLLAIQAEHEHDESQIEDMKLVLKATSEKYEAMLDDTKNEIDLLKSTIEQSKHELIKSKAEWDQKELHLFSRIKQSEESNASTDKEINRLLNLLKEAEEATTAAKEDEAHLKDCVKKAEDEVIYLQEALGEAKAESMRLKESILDKETELQNRFEENEELRDKEAASFEKIEELSKLLKEAKAECMKLKESILDKETELQNRFEENEELQNREAASIEKIEELSQLLEEAMAKKKTEENGELTDSEKDYDLLPKVVEFSEENGHGGEEKPKIETVPQNEESKKGNHQEENNVLNNETVQLATVKIENVNGKPEQEENKEKEDGPVEVEFKMWENCKIDKKEFSPDTEAEQGSFDGEVDSMVEGSKNSDKINRLGSTETVDDATTSPTKQQEQKKKKPLLRKFSSLLKKKGTSNSK